MPLDTLSGALAGAPVAPPRADVPTLAECVLSRARAAGDILVDVAPSARTLRDGAANTH